MVTNATSGARRAASSPPAVATDTSQSTGASIKSRGRRPSNDRRQTVCTVATLIWQGGTVYQFVN